MTGIIPDKAPDGTILSGQSEAFGNSSRWRFRGCGHSFVAAPGVVTQSLFDIIDVLSLSGISILCSGHVKGDHMGMDIVSDGSNEAAFGPAGYVVDNFGKNWFLNWGAAYQDTIALPYRGRLYPGLDIRFHYDSVGTMPVDVFVNIFLHKETL